MKGRPSSIESLKLSRSSARSSRAASITSSIDVQSREGSAVPVRRRDRSSRLSTSAASRSESSTIAARSSCLSASVMVGELSISAAARIAVSGVRRSCDTVRSSAVLMSSLRRSASVSTVVRTSASRSIAAASRASRPGTSRSCTRARDSGSISAGSDQRSHAALPAGEKDGQPPQIVGCLAQLQRCRGQLERRRDPLGRDGECRVDARPAEQDARELGHQVRLTAPGLGLLRTGASDLGERARDYGDSQEDTEGDPVLAIRDREPARRGDVEEVESECAEQCREQAQPETPISRDEEHRKEVDDSEGGGGGDDAKRIGDEGRQPDGYERNDEARGPGARRLAQQERCPQLHFAFKSRPGRIAWLRLRPAYPRRGCHGSTDPKGRIAGEGPRRGRALLGRLRQRGLVDLLRPGRNGGLRPRADAGRLRDRRPDLHGDRRHLRRGDGDVPRGRRLIELRAPRLQRAGQLHRGLGADAQLHHHRRHLGVLRAALPRRLLAVAGGLARRHSRRHRGCRLPRGAERQGDAGVHPSQPDPGDRRPLHPGHPRRDRAGVWSSAPTSWSTTSTSGWRPAGATSCSGSRWG